MGANKSIEIFGWREHLFHAHQVFKLIIVRNTQHLPELATNGKNTANTHTYLNEHERQRHHLQVLRQVTALEGAPHDAEHALRPQGVCYSA